MSLGEYFHCGAPTFEKLEDRTLLSAFNPASLLVANANVIREYTTGGTLIQTITLPTHNDETLTARDLELDQSGRLHVTAMNGDRKLRLLTLTPGTGAWEVNTFDDEWDQNGVSYYGGIAVTDNYVYAPDSDSGPGPLHGLVRFDLNDLNSAVRLSTVFEPHTVTYGLDGLLYILDRTGKVASYDPDTFELVRQFTSSYGLFYHSSSVTSIAVDANGDIYTTDLANNIYRHDNDGNLLDTLDEIHTYVGLVINNQGTIISGSTAGYVRITDTNLDNSTLLTVLDNSSTSFNVNFVTFATPVHVSGLPQVSISAIDDSASETESGQPADPAVFRVTRTSSTAAALTVDLLIGGTATNGTDYNAIPTQVVIPIGASFVDITISPIEDGDEESLETVILSIASSANYDVAGGPATGHIIDNDTNTVTVAAIDSTASESGGTGTLRFSRTGPTSSSLSVIVNITGTATSGSDYVAIASPVVIAAGETFVDVVITSINDAIQETLETIIITLVPDAAYSLGASVQATVTLSDNDFTEALLFADSFDRADNANINASAAGQLGDLSPLGYIPRATTSISGGKLVADGSATINHDFAGDDFQSGAAFEMYFTTTPATTIHWTGFVLGMDQAAAEQGGSQLKMLSTKAIGVLFRGNVDGQPRNFSVFLSGSQEVDVVAFDTAVTAGETYAININATADIDQHLFVTGQTATLTMTITGELDDQLGEDEFIYSRQITWVTDSNYVALEALESGSFDNLAISRVTPAPVTRADHYFISQRTTLAVPGTDPQQIAAYGLFPGMILTDNNSFSDYGRVNLRQFMPDGTQFADLNITDFVQGGNVRDMVVDSQGRIHFYDGTFNPNLTTYDPVTGEFTYRTFPGWGTVNNLTYGGLAILGDYVFASDMSTAGGTEAGIVRFNLADDTAVRKTADAPLDVAIGLDGLLYSLHNDSAPNANGIGIEVFDPITLESIRRFRLAVPVRAIAIDAQGNLYGAGGVGDDNVYKFLPDGSLLTSRSLIVEGLTDVDIDPSGMLVIASHGGEMLVTDLALSEPVYFHSGEATVNFAAIVPTTLPLRGVLANDFDVNGLPLDAELIAAPQNAASFEFFADGSFYYTPLDDFSGVETFTYRASNGEKLSAVTTVSIWVQYVDRPTVALDDAYFITQDTTLSAGPTVYLDVLNTGFNEDAGLKLSNGTLDTDWIIAAGSAEGVGTNPRSFTTSVPGVYISDGASNQSAWIRVRGVGQGDELPGMYHFERTFDMTALQAVTAQLDSLRYAVDDELISITLNGVSIFPLQDETSGGFGEFTELSSRGNGLFVEGINTLRVTVENGAGGQNPSALRLEGLVITDQSTSSFPLGVLANDTDPDATDGLSARVDVSPLHGSLLFASDGSFKYTPDAGFVGVDTFTYIVSDRLIDTDSITVTIHIDGLAIPKVLSVGLAGSDWDSGLIAELDAADGVSDGAYTLPTGSAGQFSPLTSTSLDQVVVRFNQDVVVAEDDLVMVGVNKPFYNVVTFDYNPTTFTATWTFASPIQTDKLLITVSDEVTAVGSGSPLDGEWLDATSTQSGDGIGGGDFNFRFDVLQGSVAGTQTVEVEDYLLVRGGQFAGAGDVDFNPAYDINGSGRVLVDDVILVRNLLGEGLPDGEPGAVVVQSTSTSPSESAPLMPAVSEPVQAAPLEAERLLAETETTVTLEHEPVIVTQDTAHRRALFALASHFVHEQLASADSSTRPTRQKTITTDRSPLLDVLPRWRFNALGAGRFASRLLHHAADEADGESNDELNSSLVTSALNIPASV